MHAFVFCLVFFLHRTAGVQFRVTYRCVYCCTAKQQSVWRPVTTPLQCLVPHLQDGTFIADGENIFCQFPVEWGWMDCLIFLTHWSLSLSLSLSLSHACTLLLCLHVHVCTDEVNTFWFMLHCSPKSLIDSWQLFLPKRVFQFLNLFLSRSQVLTCMFLLAACCVFTVHTDPAEHGGKAYSTVGQQAGCAGCCWEWETYLCMDIHCRIKKLFGKDNEVRIHGHVQDTVILDYAEAVALHRLTEFPDFCVCIINVYVASDLHLLIICPDD